MYRPIKNDDRCYAIAVLQLCISSPTIRGNLDKINSIEGLKKYYKFKDNELAKWIDKNFEKGGKPSEAFAEFFAPRLLKDLGITLFTQAMKELPITMDDVHVTSENQEFVSVMTSDVGQEIIHSSIAPKCWIAAVYTESINHAVNFILENDILHVLDCDLPITPVSEWIETHNFLRIEVYGRDIAHRLDRYFSVKFSTHAVQCYKTDRWSDIFNIIIHSDILSKIIICSLSLIVISLIILYKKSFRGKSL